MKTIGIVGGMSWVSTHAYYKMLNELVAARLGETHSCRLILHSIDFDSYNSAMSSNDFDLAASVIIPAAQSVERAGADFVLLASNTPHLFADQIAAALNVPFLSIVRATGRAIFESGFKKVGLLGTMFTMEKAFYRDILTGEFGIEVLTPGADDRAELHRIIIEQLAKNRFEPDSRAFYRSEIEKFASNGAEAVIFGCTEIGLLISPADSPIPAFDTAEVHCRAAVDFALA